MPISHQFLERIRSEFLEMPGMMLKLEQVMRLCGIERDACEMVLTALVEAKFLSRRSDGAYTRFTDDRTFGAATTRLQAQSIQP